jgi:2-oxoglutarate ferredoxin oxidoreductase subunit beta
MINDIKKRAVSVKAAENMSPEKLEGKFLTGLIHEHDATEFCEEYQKLVDRLGGKER